MHFTAARLRLVVVLATTMVSSLLLADEGLVFKDEKLGLTLADFCAKYDRPYDEDPRRAPSLLFGDVYAETQATAASLNPRNFQSLGMVVAQKNAPFERTSGRPLKHPETIAGVSAWVQYSFFAEEIADWDLLAKRHTFLNELSSLFSESMMSGKTKAPTWSEAPIEVLAAARRLLLGEITVHISQRDFSFVIAALKEKYGAPTEESVGSRQNAMGAKFSNQRVRWLIGQDRIYAEERFGDIDQAVIRYQSSSIMGRASAHRKNEVEKASKDL